MALRLFWPVAILGLLSITLRQYTPIISPLVTNVLLPLSITWSIVQEDGFREPKFSCYQLFLCLWEHIASYSENSEAVAFVFLCTEHLRSLDQVPVAYDLHLKDKDLHAHRGSRTCEVQMPYQKDWMVLCAGWRKPIAMLIEILGPRDLVCMNWKGVGAENTALAIKVTVDLAWSWLPWKRRLSG